MTATKLLTASLLLAVPLLVPQPATAQGGAPHDTPMISFIDAGLSEIRLRVTAGATGAPAGFSLQWVRRSDFPALSCGVTQDALWPPSDSGLICKASFSGQPRCSAYNLQPYQSVIVTVGNLNDSECGVGLDNCGANELVCGTDYVFRAFIHNSSVPRYKRSAFTPNFCASTLACFGACVSTQGFWRNHPCDWPAPFVPGVTGTAPSYQCALTGNPNQQCAADTTNTILVGTLPYDQADLLCNLNLPGQGNALRILSHQLIAAKLNVARGALPPTGCSIAMADQLMGSFNINFASIPSSTALGQQMIALAVCLDQYNNGFGGAPHCP